MSSLGIINVGIPNRCTTKDIHKKQELYYVNFLSLYVSINLDRIIHKMAHSPSKLQPFTDVLFTSDNSFWMDK